MGLWLSSYSLSPLEDDATMAKEELLAIGGIVATDELEEFVCSCAGAELVGTTTELELGELAEGAAEEELFFSVMLGEDVVVLDEIAFELEDCFPTGDNFGSSKLSCSSCSTDEDDISLICGVLSNGAAAFSSVHPLKYVPA